MRKSNKSTGYQQITAAQKHREHWMLRTIKYHNKSGIGYSASMLSIPGWNALERLEKKNLIVHICYGDKLTKGKFKLSTGYWSTNFLSTNFGRNREKII